MSSKFGAITNQHLLTKNSACVLASATTDYYNMGGVLIDSSKTFPADRRIRYCLSAGDHWGRAFIRSNGHIWSHVFHGDLSMKPKMGPANGKPLITALSAVKTGALSWTFTVTASDSDGGIQSYDWYPNSYADGKAKPDSSVSTNGVYNYTYASAALCTVRVEVVDAYKARDYATVIIKTDSGVVSTQVNTDTEKSPRQIAPGSVNRHGLEDAVLEVISLTGKVISVNRIPAGARTIEWNGVCSNGAKASSGLYLYRLKDNGTVTVFKNVFIR
ncbi:MAG: hypothetical protein JNL74_10445 [Fibrobacteres bacterium]|nr:hypothetical protein [Fibrobacterota bacterium]